MENELSYIPVRMNDGTVIKIETEQKMPIDAAILDFTNIADHIKDLAESILLPIRSLSPKKAEVGFGITFQVVDGKLETVVSQGTSKSNFKISLEWE